MQKSRDKHSHLDEFLYWYVICYVSHVVKYFAYVLSDTIRVAIGQATWFSVRRLKLHKFIYNCTFCVEINTLAIARKRNNKAHACERRPINNSFHDRQRNSQALLYERKCKVSVKRHLTDERTDVSAVFVRGGHSVGQRTARCFT